MEGKKLGIKILSVITDFLWAIPFLSVLSTVFIVNCKLANGVVSGKYFWFYGSMGLITITTLIQSLIPSIPQSFKFSKTDLFVFFFTCSVFLSALMHGDTSTNTTKLALLALLLVLYLCLRLVLGGEGQRAKGERYTVHGEGRKLGTVIGFLIIFTGLIEAVWGLLQLYGFKSSQHALFKLTGSFFNPGPYAGYLAVVFPLALQYFVHDARYTVHKNRLPCAAYRVPQIIAATTCIAIILVLPAAMSRASWLAAAAGSAVVIISRITDNRSFVARYSTLIAKKWTKIAALVLFLCLLSAAFTGMYYLKKNSADGRLLTWKVSLTALVEHPFGVGLGHFPSAYGDAQTAYFASGKASETEEYVAGNPEYGFNELLQIAIESGIVSLVLFVTMLVFAFRGLIKNKNWGVMGSLVALLVFACFSYPFSVLPFPIVFVFLLAMSNFNGTRMTRMARINADEKIISAIISVICVISVLLILYRQYPVYKAYNQWNKSRMYYQMGMYKEAVQNYEPLYPYLNDQIQFLFEYGRSLSQDSQGIAGQARNDSAQVRHDRLTKSNEVLQQAMKISCDPMLYNVMGENYQAMKEYNKAEEYLLKSTRIVPNRLYPYYLLMKLYIKNGDVIKARETAGIVLTKEPKVQSQAVREMREEARKIMNDKL